MITFVFVLVLVLPLRYSNDDVGDNEHNNHVYAPTDTAIINFHHPFCDRLTLYSHDSEYFVEVTLLLLEETPPLERREGAAFYREPILTRDYEYWRMFLYPGSSVGYSACSVKSAESPVTFYLVKGNRNFEKWQIGHSNTHIEEQQLTTACEDDNTTYSYQVNSQDNYYFIFNSESSAETITGIAFDFERTLYDISENSTVISECSVILNASSSCGVSIPYSGNPVVLLQLESLIPDPMEWDAGIKVDVTCSARAWLYVIISLSALAFVGLLIFSAIIVYFIFCNKKKRVRISSTASQREDSHLISEKKQDTYDPPPPYQPQ